jgi:hypothetical protein
MMAQLQERHGAPRSVLQPNGMSDVDPRHGVAGHREPDAPSGGGAEAAGDAAADSAVALEFSRRRARVVWAILPVTLFTVLGVLLWRSSLLFLILWPLSLFALGAYVNRVFRCPRCEAPIRGKPPEPGRCHICGARLE